MLRDDLFPPAIGFFAVARRRTRDFDVRIEAAHIPEAGVCVEVDVRRHRVGDVELVRVFERFVVTLRDGKDGDFMRLAEIEAGGANEISDVLGRMPDSMCVEVATLSRVDLDRRCGLQPEWGEFSRVR